MYVKHQFIHTNGGITIGRAHEIRSSDPPILSPAKAQRDRSASVRLI